MPRVGSKHRIAWKPEAIQRAIVTFCWLPPLNQRTWRCARVSICNSVPIRASHASSAGSPRHNAPICLRRCWKILRIAALAGAEIGRAAPPPIAAPAAQEDNNELSERVRLVVKREPDLTANVLRMWLQESKI